MTRYFLVFGLMTVLAACGQSGVDYSKLPKNEAELSERFEAFANDRGVPSDLTSSGEQLFFIQGSDVTMLSMMAVAQKGQLEALKVANAEIDLDLLTRAQDIYLEEAKLDMPWVASKFASLYQETFDEDELLQIRAFLLTDVGQNG